MEKRNHLYVNRKNGLTWLMAVCMVGSAVARIALSGVKGTGEPQNVWSQILLPVAATLLYALIVLLDGKVAAGDARPGPVRFRERTGMSVRPCEE